MKDYKNEGNLKQIQLENNDDTKYKTSDPNYATVLNVQDIKINVDLIRQICCAFENTVNGQKFDKLELFLNIYINHVSVK
jgi:hypothetical protein